MRVRLAARARLKTDNVDADTGASIATATRGGATSMVLVGCGGATGLRSIRPVRKSTILRASFAALKISNLSSRNFLTHEPI